MKPLAPVTKIFTFKPFASEAVDHNFRMIDRWRSRKIFGDEVAPASIVRRAAKSDDMILQGRPADYEEISKRIFNRSFEAYALTALCASKQRHGRWKTLLKLLSHSCADQDVGQFMYHSNEPFRSAVRRPNQKCTVQPANVACTNREGRRGSVYSL
jgi:hypothetical protein